MSSRKPTKRKRVPLTGLRLPNDLDPKEAEKLPPEDLRSLAASIHSYEMSEGQTWPWAKGLIQATLALAKAFTEARAVYDTSAPGRHRPAPHDAFAQLHAG